MEANFTNSACVQFAASFVTYQATLWTLIVILTILLICGIFVVCYLLSKQLCFDLGPWHGKHSFFPPRRITPAEGVREDGLTETNVFTLVENDFIIANECRELSITRESHRELENKDDASYIPCPDKENIFEVYYNFDVSSEIRALRLNVSESTD